MVRRAGGAGNRASTSATVRLAPVGPGVRPMPAAVAGGVMVTRGCPRRLPASSPSTARRSDRGSMDVAINSHGVKVEKELDRPLMSLENAGLLRLRRSGLIRRQRSGDRRYGDAVQALVGFLHETLVRLMVGDVCRVLGDQARLAVDFRRLARGGRHLLEIG